MSDLLDVSKLYEQDSKLNKDDVEMLEGWCKQQRHFPEVKELQIALALHACFYNVEQTKNCLENYFTIRGLCRDFFAGGNPEKDPDLKMALNVSFMTILPKKSPEGYKILYTRMIDTNPDHYNPQKGLKLFDMNIMRDIHTVGPANGLVSVVDMKGGVFSHVTKLNLGDFKKFMVYLQTAMPIRLMAIHFINVVPFMDKLLSIIKPFINKEMFQKLMIHNDINNLYKHIPKECMPSDFGGQAESIDILFEKSKKLILDYQWFYDFQDTVMADEKKRIGPRKNADMLFGFDGTFKKLSVD